MVLKKVLSKIAAEKKPDIDVGLSDYDDAAIMSLPDKSGKLVQTVDVLKRFALDPYTFGKVIDHGLR